ncbi:MAG: response regulator [Desulfarculaceae bacterium]|jgi:DNA-binding NarL/FixJ family response regulator
MANIMIVEDEFVVAADLRSRLLALGFEVCPLITSGEDSLVKLEEMHPDLVIMDVGLHGKMDGIEAAKEIQNRYQTPVVFLTAYGNPEMLRNLQAVNPCGVISKPYNPRTIGQVIENALNRHRSGGC